jgi:hypothetical protein
MIYLPKVVIFHTTVKLPDGARKNIGHGKFVKLPIVVNYIYQLLLPI